MRPSHPARCALALASVVRSYAIHRTPLRTPKDINVPLFRPSVFVPRVLRSRDDLFRLFDDLLYNLLDDLLLLPILWLVDEAFYGVRGQT